MSKRLKTHLSFTNQTRTATTTGTATIALRVEPETSFRVPRVRFPVARVGGTVAFSSRFAVARRPGGGARGTPRGGPRPRQHVLEFDFREPPRGPGAAWRRTSLRPPARGARPARTARPTLQRRTCPQRRETTPTRRRPRGPGAARAARTDRCGDADPELKGRSHAGAGHGARGAASHCLHWPSHGAHAPVDTHSVSLTQRGVVYYFSCL